MTGIDVTPLGSGRFGVQVSEGTRTTGYTVMVPGPLLEDLGLGPERAEEVVRRSFEFLLEREPATSILPEFSLDVIGRYWSGYKEDLRRRLT